MYKFGVFPFSFIVGEIFKQQTAFEQLVFLKKY